MKNCLEQHALNEFIAAGWMDKSGAYLPDEDDGGNMQEMICKDILEILNTLVRQDNSGFSITYLMCRLEKLVKFEPLSPLKGTDDEWIKIYSVDDEYGNGENLWQNKRCNRVFKNDSHAWDIEGKTFVDENGVYWQNDKSQVDITFPYTPTTEIIKVNSVDDVYADDEERHEYNSNMKRINKEEK